MIRSRGSGFVSHTEERKEVDWALASKYTRSTSNSRAKRVERNPSEQKTWYEREEIASQYLYCLKDPPCQTCCRYNEKLFKTLLDQKGKFPPCKHQNDIKITAAHGRSMTNRSRISQGGLDEETQKYDPNNLSFCSKGVPSSDMPVLTRPGRPDHPFHLDVQDSQPPRPPCCARELRHVTRASDAAALPGGNVARPPSMEHDCGFQAKDVIANSSKIPVFPPPPASVGLTDDLGKKKTHFLDRPKTDMTNSNLLPSLIPDGFRRSDALPDIGNPIPGRLPRDASQTLLRPIRSILSSRPLLSQPTSPGKIQPRSPGEGNWRKAEEKAFFCRRSATCKLCCTDRNQIGSEPKSEKTESSSSSSSSSSVDKPWASQKTDYTSLSSVPPRACVARPCTESAHDQSLGRQKPMLSPPSDDRTLTLLERDSYGKLWEPPPIRNPSTAKPPRPPPSRPRTISPSLRMPPSASDRCRSSERLLGRKIVCKHSPCKPCNISCFDQYYSPNRTRDFDTCYDKPCTLPDIFARRTNLNLNLGLSPQRHDYMRRVPSGKIAPKRPSKWGWGSACQQSPYAGPRDHSAIGKARWKERDIYSSPSMTKKRVLYGKAEWKEMIEKVLLAGR